MSPHRLPARTLLFALALALAAPAAAQPRGPGRGPGPGHGPGHPPREEVEQRVRTLRAVALANRLELSESEALRLNAVMKTYDQRRDALRARMHEAFQRLRTLADADAPDAEAVQEAVDAVLDGQQEMARLRREEIQTLMEDLDPARQARLLVFFHEFPGEIRRLMREARRGGGMMPDAGDAP